MCGRALLTRLGGYDAIAPSMICRKTAIDPLRGAIDEPGVVHNRERQLAVDFVAASAGGRPSIRTRHEVIARRNGDLGRLCGPCAVCRQRWIHSPFQSQSVARSNLHHQPGTGNR
jgi:hypothetical protein